MASVVSTIGVRVDDFQAVDIADPWWMPRWIALAERWRHLHPRFQNKVAWAPPPRIQFDGVVYRSGWNRLLDVRFARSTMPPPGTIFGLSRINDKAEGVVSLPEGF